VTTRALYWVAGRLGGIMHVANLSRAWYNHLPCIGSFSPFKEVAAHGCVAAESPDSALSWPLLSAFVEEVWHLLAEECFQFIGPQFQSARPTVAMMDDCFPAYCTCTAV